MQEKRKQILQTVHIISIICLHIKIYDSSRGNDIYWELKMKPLNRFVSIYLIIWDVKNLGV